MKKGSDVFHFGEADDHGYGADKPKIKIRGSRIRSHDHSLLARRQEATLRLQFSISMICAPSNEFKNLKRKKGIICQYYVGLYWSNIYVHFELGIALNLAKRKSVLFISSDDISSEVYIT